jgi:hypothetical protein
VTFSYSNVFILLFFYMKTARHHVFSINGVAHPAFTVVPSLDARAGDRAGDRSLGHGERTRATSEHVAPHTSRLDAATRRVGAEVAPPPGSCRVPPTEAGRTPLGIAARRRLRRGTPKMEGLAPPPGWRVHGANGRCDRDRKIKERTVNFHNQW